MKLAFVSAHPAPYRDPFLRRLAKESAVETKIFSLFSDDNGHAYWDLGAHGYDSELIGRRDEYWLLLFWRLYRRVISGGYDVICWPGFHRPCTKLAMVVCALLGKKYGFCADSIVQPGRSGLMMCIKRFVVRRASFIFVPGLASKRFYVEAFGFPAARICTGVYALEGEELERHILEMRETRDALRAKYGLKPDDVVFLMVANMLKTRHYPITGAAFMRFAESHPNCRFVMVGKGPDLEEMTALAKAHSEMMVVPGASFADMQELYALADVYVHGGTEPASSALIIGAIAHLPVMSSPAVGCSADVVREGETGVLVSDYLSVFEWTAAFERMMVCRDHWETFGGRARELSRPLDCSQTVASFVDLFQERVR